MKYICLLIGIIIFLYGCSFEAPSQVSFSEYLDMEFKTEFNKLVIEKKDDIKLPFKNGEVDSKPFFVKDEELFFISRSLNSISDYNTKTRQLKKFSHQELYINAIGYMDGVVYINDAKKGRIIRFASDFTHYQNYLGQLKEDSKHNGNRLFLFRTGVFQINYDLKRIFFYSFKGKMRFDIPSPAENIKDIQLLGDDFVFFYPGRVFIYTSSGKIKNELKIRYNKHFCDENGIFLLNDGAFLFYDKSLKLKKKYVLHMDDVKNIRRASLKLFYYQYGDSVYHLLSSGKSVKMMLPSSPRIVDYIPTYDNNFLVLGDNDSLTLYSHHGNIIKKYSLIEKYYSLLLFKDNKGKFYIVDIRKQLLKVINEATFGIIQEIINNSAAISKDSNIEIDPAGNVYFVNRSDGRIEKMTYDFQNIQFDEPDGIRRLPFSSYDQIIPMADSSMLLFSKEKQSLFCYSKNKEQLFQVHFSKEDSTMGVFHADWICANALSEFVALDTKREALFFFSKDGDLLKKVTLEMPLDNKTQIEFDTLGRLWINSMKQLYCIRYNDTKGKELLKYSFDTVPKSIRLDEKNRLFVLFASDDSLKVNRYEVFNPFDKAMEYYKTHRFKMAISNFDKAYKLSKNNKIVEFYLANCYVQLGHYDKARNILNMNIPEDESLKKQWLSLSKKLESLK